MSIYPLSRIGCYISFYFQYEIVFTFKCFTFKCYQNLFYYLIFSLVCKPLIHVSYMVFNIKASIHPQMLEFIIDIFDGVKNSILSFFRLTNVIV